MSHIIERRRIGRVVILDEEPSDRRVLDIIRRWVSRIQRCRRRARSPMCCTRDGEERNGLEGFDQHREEDFSLERGW
jgi:hypothetical protein